MAITFLCSSSLRYQIACIILVACSSLLFLPLSESLYFEVTNFKSDATNIVLLGDAVASNEAIHFNEASYFTRVGQVKYAHPVQIWDRKSGNLSDFTTHFIFTSEISISDQIFGGGIAFFLAPDDFQIPPNSEAGFLGLFNETYTNSPKNQMIVVEFDPFPDLGWDPPFEHVSINRNSIYCANYTAWNVSMHQGPIDAWVSYNSTTQNLNLIWSYGAGNTSDLSYQVDLRKVVPEWVTIGFSASRSIFAETYTLQYWEFNSSLSTGDKKEDNSNKWKLAVGLTLSFSVIIIGGIITCTFFTRRRRRKTIQESHEAVSLTFNLQNGAAKRYSYSELILATNNFSEDLKLGQGGFGSVYKGYLPREAMTIAVKKISHGSKQGKKEYMAEVKINGNLIRHRNLVPLIGWCHDETRFLLVYEYMPNGSLDSHLFGKKSPLKWSVRYKIAMGLASALLYLHEEVERCVVHRDIKTSNIMLDSEFNVKLGDFGLARLMEHELGPQTTALAGTLGYMAPEYISTGKASKESDVYSFGVVALEIACGRRVRDDHRNSDVTLVQWLWDLHGKGELLSGVDSSLDTEFDDEQVKRLMMVGLWCAHPDWSIRPSIRQAFQALKFEGALPNLPMKMPVAMYSAGLDACVVSSAGATITKTSGDLER